MGTDFDRALDMPYSATTSSIIRLWDTVRVRDTRSR
jgi:hypothetical protein